jgi:alpha-galactosidase/6-phospho-beta-glucosidase family protein
LPPWFRWLSTHFIDTVLFLYPVRTFDLVLFSSVLIPISLPELVRQLCEQVSRVHECSICAAVTGDIALVDEAIDIDPAITQKDTAKQAIREMIRANADVLPLFKH